MIADYSTDPQAGHGNSSGRLNQKEMRTLLRSLPSLATEHVEAELQELDFEADGCRSFLSFC